MAAGPNIRLSSSEVTSAPASRWIWPGQTACSAGTDIDHDGSVRSQAPGAVLADLPVVNLAHGGIRPKKRTVRKAKFKGCFERDASAHCADSSRSPRRRRGAGAGAGQRNASETAGAFLAERAIYGASMSARSNPSDLPPAPSRWTLKRPRMRAALLANPPSLTITGQPNKHWQQGARHVTNALRLRWKRVDNLRILFIMSQHRSLRAVATVGGNATSSNASSAWACSRNVVNGRTATASRACGKRSRTPEPMRSPPSLGIPHAGAASGWWKGCVRERAFTKVFWRKPAWLRRAGEAIILAGRVTVNGREARELGTKVDRMRTGDGGRRPGAGEAEDVRGVEQAARLRLLATR